MAERIHSQPEPDPKQEKAEPAPVAEPAAPAAAPMSANRVLAMQRTAGNATVSAMLGTRVLARDPPLAPAPPSPVTHKTRAEIDAMTLSDFDTFAEGQADWANEPGRPSGTPAIPPFHIERLRKLLEFAREEDAGRKPILAGCGTMTVADMVATGLSSRVRSDLRFYSAAVAQTHVTAEVQQTADVAKARRYGAALEKLETEPGPGVTHVIMQQAGGSDSLGQLIDSGFLDDFVKYSKTGAPVLEAPAAEIDSYLALRAEGANPLAYRGRLPDVRNYHRFEKAALDAAALNAKYTKKDKPLFLILHSNFDHNGAFHRDPNLTSVITDTRHVTILIEGKETLAEIQSELGPLARKYGQGDKIQQVMFAGHGNNNVIQMAGTMDEAALDAGADSDHAEQDEAILSAPGHTAQTEELMRELLANMSSDPSARIVLNGCLTASNSVNAPLDPDPDTAAKQVHDAITAQPSLQTFLGQAAAAASSPVAVKGANASFGQVGLQDAAGNLDIVAAGGADPQLTATKLEYVKGGTEPQGALRAVLEVWASDRLASPKTTTAIDAVRNRLATEPANKEWDPRIIRTLYEIVAANPDNAELIRSLGVCAGDLGELKHEQNCRVRALRNVPEAQINTIFTGLTATDFWTSEARIPLVVLQRWLHTDAAKKADFKAKLGADFTCAQARTYVDLALLAPALPTLLPVADAAAPTPGALKLALLGVAGASVEATSKTFLRAVVGSGTSFSPALDIDGKLGGMSTQADVEVAIGVRGPAAVPPSGGPTAPPNNVDLDGDGVNDFRVEPMTRRGATAASTLNVRERPDTTARILDGLPRGSQVFLIGTVDDWYAIDHGRKTAFVHKDFVTLKDAL
jgi:hypothetical protein